MVYLNYSKLQEKEDKIYNIGGKRIAGGISIVLLASMVIWSIITVGIGFMVCKLIGIPFISLSNLKPPVYSLIAGCLIGFVSLKIKIGTYSVYQYVLEYIMYLTSTKYCDIYQNENFSKKQKNKLMVSDQIN